MEKLPKSIFSLALLITLFLLSTVVLIGILLDNKREVRISDLSADMIKSISEMQTFELMAETYGDSMACLAYRSKLEHLDKSVWDLGIKIDSYRVASEEFQTDPFYLEQKKAFNENEVTYMMLLLKIQKNCNYTQPVLAFFYANSERCAKCDDQSFVLTDIKKSAKKEISIFSFDTDLNLTTVDLLTKYHRIEELPCVVMGGEKFCGMHDKEFFVKRLCEVSNISICS
ncbi:hypothetical protein HY641_00605 [Candidatus Woesearchaeota archaeon]|nr:hypothetical protein [Candidatus Woesearchaeota archaeon]